VLLCDTITGDTDSPLGAGSACAGVRSKRPRLQLYRTSAKVEDYQGQKLARSKKQKKEKNSKTLFSFFDFAVKILLL
jgi:hypothetical protein